MTTTPPEVKAGRRSTQHRFERSSASVARTHLAAAPYVLPIGRPNSLHVMPGSGLPHSVKFNAISVEVSQSRASSDARKRSRTTAGAYTGSGHHAWRVIDTTSATVAMERRKSFCVSLANSRSSPTGRITGSHGEPPDVVCMPSFISSACGDSQPARSTWRAVRVCADNSLRAGSLRNIYRRVGTAVSTAGVWFSDPSRGLLPRS